MTYGIRCRGACKIMAQLMAKDRTIGELMDATGANRQTIQLWVDAMIEEGIARKTGTKRPAKGPAAALYGWVPPKVEVQA